MQQSFFLNKKCAQLALKKNKDIETFKLKSILMIFNSTFYKYL